MSIGSLIAFGVVSLGIVCTPGPNMIYLISRTLTQIVISFTVNLLIVFTASKIAAWSGARPTWLKLQRWLMAGVLTGLAVKLAMERRQ